MENSVGTSDEEAGGTVPITERALEWFRGSIGEPSRLQLKAWRSIQSRGHTLIISPTGSGKTLAAMLPPVSNLIEGKWSRRSISIVYVTPMRALGADLVKALNNLSTGIGPFPGKAVRRGRGRKASDAPLVAPLQVGIRTGDVPQYERRKLLTQPPDVLVITPENLLLMLCSGAREALVDVSFLVIDELHELVGSKRGALLSLSLELLCELLHRKGRPEPTRVGLSATVRPERSAASFLGGYDWAGRPRRITIVKEQVRKAMKMEIRTLRTEGLSQEARTEALLEEVASSIKGEKGPVVVFQNTRRGAEEMSYSLGQRGLEGVMAHHGSLGPEVRKRAEEGLKDGSLRAIVSSTSLELGVDIGGIDLVLQVSSPRSPTRLVQRFGRSGHGLDRTSHGALISTSREDLIESMAVLRTAARGELERVSPPVRPTDVLAQFIVGTSLIEDGLDTGTIMAIARRTVQFKQLKGTELQAIVSLLSERLPGPKQPAPRLRKEAGTGLLHPNRDTRQAFYLNCGTIPREVNYKVFDGRGGHLVGELSRDFAESLYERDVIMLASKSYRVTGFSGSRVMVKEEPGAMPTSPIWKGESPPRPMVVTKAIYDLHRKCPSKGSGSSGPFRWRLDRNSMDLLRESLDDLSLAGIVPTEKVIPVERVSLPDGRTAHIFHHPVGKRSTDLLGRVLSYGLRRRFGASMDHTSSDDGLAISSPLALEVEDLRGSLPEGHIRDMLRDLTSSSSNFRSRFSACAGRALLVLSRFRGRETGMMYRRSTIERLLSTVTTRWPSRTDGEKGEGAVAGLKLIFEEALEESMSDGTDMGRLEGLMTGLREGGVSFEVLPVGPRPSFLGASIIRAWGSRGLGEDMGPSSFVAITAVGTDGQGMVGTSMQCPPDRKTTGDPVPSFPDLAPIIYRRRTSLEPKGGLVKVLRGVPFFTHPLEVLRRAEEADLNQLRSAVKGGSLVPVRSCGGDRMAHPEWVAVFQALSSPPPEMTMQLSLLLIEGRYVSRSEVGAASNTKGTALTALMDGLARSNVLACYPSEAKFHLGAPEGYFSRPAPRHKEETQWRLQLEALVHLLSRLGPFTMTELAWLFNWDEGYVPPGITKGLEEGVITSFTGPPGPMDRSNSYRSSDQGGEAHIWLSKVGEGFHPSVGDPDPRPVLMTHADLTLMLTSGALEGPEREHVRDAMPELLFMSFPGSERAIRAMVSERRDLVLFRDLEVPDYSLVGQASGLVLEASSLYGRLGYEVLCIDNLMGVPAGDAARRVLDPLLTAGFCPQPTEKGTVLIRGCQTDMTLSRDRVLSEVLSRQGLMPGQKKGHPVEVLELLGGISDRWEVLSRLGSSRYRKARGLNKEGLSSRQERLWAALEKGLKDGSEAQPVLAPIELTDQMESLPEIKDLARGFGLWKVLLDQPVPVWAFEAEAVRAPPPPPMASTLLDKATRKLVDRLLSVGRKGSSDLLRTVEDDTVSMDLVRFGLAVQDAWGNHQFPFDDSRFGRARRSRDRQGPKGLRQRKWLLRCAHALGLFTLGDLLNYSPMLDDPCKVRTLLNELSKGPLTRRLYYESSPVLVHGLLEAFSSEARADPTGTEGGSNLTVISPKDRIARVLGGDVKAVLARRQGFLIMKGTRCISTVTLVRTVPGRGSGSKRSHGQTYGGPTLFIKKAWMDMRLRRSIVLRDIKRAFFEHGLKVLTIEEGSGLEDLYKDMEPSEAAYTTRRHLS